MNIFSKLSFNPEDPAAVLDAIGDAEKIGSKFNPFDFLPSQVLHLVKGIDHIGFSVAEQTLPAIMQYQKDHGYSLRSFQSTIAAKEFENPITIYELQGGALPLEMMVPHDSRQYPQPHIAFSVAKEENLHVILSSLTDLFKLPSFMSGPMKNDNENISMIYLDGRNVRLEFIYRRKNQGVLYDV